MGESETPKPKENTSVFPNRRDSRRQPHFLSRPCLLPLPHVTLKDRGRLVSHTKLSATRNHVWDRKVWSAVTDIRVHPGEQHEVTNLLRCPPCVRSGYIISSKQRSGADGDSRSVGVAFGPAERKKKSLFVCSI